MAEVNSKSLGQAQYKRVRGLGRAGTLSRASLFTAHDHLLLCDYRTGFTERYKRFYFADIQAIIIQKTAHWFGGMMIWGFFAICFLVIALSTHWNLFLRISEGVCVFFVLRHLVRGPSCRTHIQTAVQTDVLPMLKRVRKTNRVLHRIFPIIEQAQGPATAVPEAPPSVPVMAQPVSSPTILPPPVIAIGPSPSAGPGTTIVPYPLSWLHLTLFTMVVLTGLSAIWEANQPSTGSLTLLVILFALSVITGIVTLVRQAWHRVHFGAALVTWFVVITFVLGMGGVDYVFTMVQVFNEARTNRHPPSPVMDFLSPSALRQVAGFDTVLWVLGVWALLLGLLGLIFVFMRAPGRVQPPPLPADLPA